MKSEEIVTRYNADRRIFGRMNGSEYTTIRTKNGIERTKDTVLEYTNDELLFCADKEVIIMRAWPNNAYRFADYGKTWAFTEEELD